ncbi:hypothetical protein GUITHDRAFT_135471 [Guillardia theta CCMP2712]|uniref:Uncharacterized protein n=2 Tax=Guillardia theta TaxID=55529 RepID=L1JPZ3_GUITC|nr:hypothetical protein GUITHDRAFT_135471 [Guillardia theta CCMP2712]EKX50324.1 hypothetical protein GUITHDRAFT_135471 [Guillardia theta CCMP2712]|eukprot:XP_005837304.1 hypothetical protein GUITHDRAFT_135471 [Guillardia theta CCMP2712]
MSAKVTKYVALQLKNLLGTYLDGVTEDSLNLQLLGGKLKLENLSIKETALAWLELPFRTSGKVGHLELSVNFLRFWWNEPVIIILKDVEINFEPLEQASFVKGDTLSSDDYASHFERIRIWKESQIHALNEKQEDGERKAPSFLARLAKKVRDNLQIHISNFRVNIIDKRASREGHKCFTLGIVLGSLVAMSASNNESKGNQPSEDTTATEKVLEIKDLQMHLVSHDDERRDSAVAEKNLEDFQIIKPIHLVVRLTINDNHQFKAPQFHFRLEMNKLEWRFFKMQYIIIYKILEECNMYRSRIEHWYWRPREPPLKDPKKWFRYAIRRIRDQVHHRRCATKLGEQYTCTYLSQLLSNDSNDEGRTLRAFENHLNAESIASFRQAAKQMSEAHEAAVTEAKKAARSQQSWGQWARSFVVSSYDQDLDKSSLDEESKKILNEALQFSNASDDAIETNAYPREYARFRIDFSISMGSLTLIEKGWLANEDPKELCYMQFDVLDGKYDIRRDTYMYGFSLLSFEMQDRQNSIDGLSRIASCNHEISDDDSEAKPLLTWNWDTLPTSDSPKDGGNIAVTLDGLHLIYSVECVLGVYNFWIVPKEDRFPTSAAEIVQDHEDDSSEWQLQLWKDRTRFDKRMQWHISVLKPCILFPADHKSDSEPVIVFDLDSFDWKSVLISGDDEKLEFFDRNVLDVKNTRFRLAEDINIWLHCLANNRTAWIMKGITLATDFDFQITWDWCKLTEPIRVMKDLPRQIVKGTLPCANLFCTAEQYNSFWYAFFKVVRSHYPPTDVVKETSTIKVVKPESSGLSFEFAFDMNELKLNLLESASDSSAHERKVCAHVLFRGFNTRYHNGYKSSLRMLMQHLEIKDEINQFSFASSQRQTAGQEEDEFVCIERGWIAPEIFHDYQYDAWWDFNFKSLSMNWNESTVRILTDFCTGAFRDRSQRAGQARLKSSLVDDDLFYEAEENQHDPQPATDEPHKPKQALKITASIRLLSATLLRAGDTVVWFSEANLVLHDYHFTTICRILKFNRRHAAKVDLLNVSGEQESIQAPAFDQSRLIGTFEMAGLSIRAGMHSRDHGSTDLVRCNITKMLCNFQKDIDNLEMDFKVNSVDVTDITESDAMGNKDILNADSLNEDTSHLATIHRKEFLSDCPEKEEYDVLWRLDFQNLILNWNDKTVSMLLNYVNTMQDISKSLLSGRDTSGSPKIEAGEVSRELDQSLEDREASKKGRKVVKATASIRLLSATLLRAGDTVVWFSEANLVLHDYHFTTICRILKFNRRHAAKVDLLNVSGEQESIQAPAFDQSRLIGTFEMAGLSIRAGMHSRDHGSTDLVRCNITKMLCNFQKDIDNLEMDFKVNSVDVTDITEIEKGERVLLSSRESDNQSGELARIQYASFSPSCQHKPDYDVLWRLDFQNLILNWNDKTVSMLLNYVNTMQDISKSLLSGRDTSGSPKIEAGEVSRELDQSLEDREASKKGRKVVKATASIRLLSATLLRAGDTVGMDVKDGSGKYLMDQVNVGLKLDRCVKTAGKGQTDKRIEVAIDVSEVCSHVELSQLHLFFSVLGSSFSSPKRAIVLSPTKKSRNSSAGRDSNRLQSKELMVNLSFAALKLLTWSLRDGKYVPHTFFSLEQPKFYYEALGESRKMSCSVQKFEMTFEGNDILDKVSLVRYYHENDSLVPETEIESNPQLKIEYSDLSGQEEKPGCDSRLRIVLFRPEMMLAPSAVAEVFLYFRDILECYAQFQKKFHHSPSASTTEEEDRLTSLQTMKTDIEIYKPRISFLDEKSKQGAAKIVLQSDIRLTGMSSHNSWKFQSCDLEHIEMFVTEKVTSQAMRSIVDPFDMNIALKHVEDDENSIELLAVDISSAVEAQLSYQDWILAYLMFGGWKELWSLLDSQSNLSKGKESAKMLFRSKSTTAFTFCCPQICVTFINDCFSESHIPVLEVRGSPVAVTNNVKGSVWHQQVNVGLEIDYFNMEIAEWEPFLEYWPLNLSREMANNSITLKVGSSDPGEFNLTLGFLECLSLNRQTLQRALDNLESDGAMEETYDEAGRISILHPYHVRNDIGVAVECATVDDPGNELSIVVAPGACVPMDIKSSRRNQRKRLAKAQRISLNVGEGWYPCVVRIDRVGKQNLVFKPIRQEGNDCRVICDIKLVEGSKHISLVSSVRVVNKTSHSFSLLFEPDGSQPQEGGILDLSPQQSLSVPVQLVAHCCLRIQPTERHKWSSPLELRKPPRDVNGKACPRIWLYNAEDSSESTRDSFYMWVRMNSPDMFRINITLTPILTLCNELALPINYGICVGDNGQKKIPKSQNSIAPGEKVEHHNVSPAETAFFAIKLPGMKWSNYARIQADRRVNQDVELHREVYCKDDADDSLKLCVSISNFVIRDATSDFGRDRRITLSCPYWIRNLTGLPLSFCLGSPNLNSGDMDVVMPTPRMLSNVNMHPAISSFPSGFSFAGMNSMQGMMLARSSADASVDFMMPGLKEFQRMELEKNTVSNGLVERPIGSERLKPEDYPSLMFSFSASKRRLLHVKVAGSSWSEGIPIHDGGASGMVEIRNEGRGGNEGPSSDFLFQLSLTTQTKKGTHFKTEILTFRPRFVIVNKLDQTVHYRQMDTEGIYIVRPDHKTNFHWPNANCPNELCIRIVAEVEGTETTSMPYEWSGAFDISTLGESHIRLRSKEPEWPSCIVRAGGLTGTQIEVRNIGETLHVIFQAESSSIPPYRISNMTSLALLVNQAVQGYDQHVDLVPPNSSIPFAWDKPLLEHVLAVRVAGAGDTPSCALCKFDKIGQTKFFFINDRKVLLSVIADGPTRVLRAFFESRTEMGVESPVAAREAMQGPEGSTDEGNKFQMSVEFNRVSVTMVDLHPQELVCMHLQCVQLNYEKKLLLTEKNRSLLLLVQDFQVDNMLQRTPHPVVLYSSIKGDDKPFLQLEMVQDLNGESTILTFQSVLAEIKDVELNLEGRIVMLVYLYYLSCMELLQVSRGDVQVIDENALFSPNSSNKIYVQSFALPAVNVNFSFARRDLGEGDFKNANEVAQRLSWLAASVDNAPLTLNDLSIHHAFMDPRSLLNVLREHYQKECVRQLYRILGSVEVLGNPVGLMRNLGTGFKAFRTGISGLRNGDQQSFKDGTKVLVQHVGHGFSNTLSKVSSSVSRGLASVALDKDFIREREEQKDYRGRPEDYKVGFKQGTSHLARSVGSGISGFMNKPVEGYNRAGMKGMMQGMVHGVAGLICKPTSGLLDLIANTSEGLRNQTNPLGKVTVGRMREPRLLNYDRVLRSLNAAPLPHIELFHRLIGDTRSDLSLHGDLQSDMYRSHIVLDDGVLFFTDKHCLYARRQPAASDGWGEKGINAPVKPAQASGCSLVWCISWRDLGGIEARGDCVWLQADPSAYADWEKVPFPCREDVQLILYAMHDAWKGGVEDEEVELVA